MPRKPPAKAARKPASPTASPSKPKRARCEPAAASSASARTFTGEVRGEGPGQAWAFVTLPFDVPALFGSRGRISVKATVGAQVFRTSIFPTGDGTHHIMFNKAMQSAAGVGPGGKTKMTIERDDEARTVQIPAELAAAFKIDANAKKAFDGYSWSHRNAFCQFVSEAKKEQTRIVRAAKALIMLREGKKIY